MLREACRQSGFKERMPSSVNPAEVPSAAGTHLSSSGFILFLFPSVQLFSKSWGGFLFLTFLALSLIHSSALSFNCLKPPFHVVLLVTQIGPASHGVQSLKSENQVKVFRHLCSLLPQTPREQRVVHCKCLVNTLKILLSSGPSIQS